MAENEAWEAPPKSYPFLDRMTFTMQESDVNWDVLDQIDDSEPSSKQYRKLMQELKITTRPIKPKGKRARWDDE